MYSYLCIVPDLYINIGTEENCQHWPNMRYTTCVYWSNTHLEKKLDSLSGYRMEKHNMKT